MGSEAPQAMSFDQTQYKEKSRKLISLVNQLRDAGAQFSLDLPCMVVCGNQSAGKSSLLERLCNVKLPRAAGTCTKCPAEVRLSTASPGGAGVTWCCQVKLRREYGKDNQQLDPKPKEQAFKTLTQEHKDQLHHYISAAQRALLNPDIPPDIFVRDADSAAAKAAAEAASGGGSGSDSGTEQQVADKVSSAAAAAAVAAAASSTDALKFTRNVVVLEITGADVDLSLIDLPGIIQTEQGDDVSNVELVQQLVRQYISRERAIIVATITCKDDVDNQSIVSLAREVDKDGHRTVGVLTKADTIEPGTHHTWLPVLQGTAYNLRLGYYCVVNPSQEDLNNNISPAQAAAKEAQFFGSDSFFSSDQVAAVRERFGVDPLRVQLSKQLVALTQRELPKMKEAVENALTQVEEQLRRLPPPPSSDASLELFRRLRDLSSSVKDAVQGKDDVTFFRAADSCYKDLRTAVLAARPTVKLTPAAQAGQAAGPSFVFGIGGIGGSGGSSTGGTIKQLGEEDSEFWLGSADFGAATAEEGEKPEGLITLERVRELAGKYRGSELPSFPPYRVLEVLVQGLKGRWDDATQRCLHDVAEQLQGLTNQLVGEHFGQFAAAQVHIRSLLYGLHAKLLEDTKQRLHEVMAMEKEQTWTQNDHYFSDSKQRFMDMLLKRVYGDSSNDGSSLLNSSTKCSNGETVQFNINHALCSLKSAGANINKDDLDFIIANLGSIRAKKQKHCHNGNDEGLLEIIAGTLAYFKVSSKRVIDGVPMHLRHFLLERYCKEVDELPVQLAATIPAHSPALAAQTAAGGAAVASGNASGAGAGGEGGSRAGKGQQALSAEQLMAEDGSTADKRSQLKRQLEQLNNVRRILNVF